MMPVHAVENAVPPLGPTARTRGDAYEGIAFTFCKAATIILLTQRFALPVAAGAAAIFYLLAYRSGKSTTRCVLRVPLLISGFWGIVACVSLYWVLRPMIGR